MQDGRDDMAKMILIIENDDLGLKLLRDVLHAGGYETEQMKDGRKAIARAREIHPDLIVMDIEQADLADCGVRRTLKADETLKHIPIIATTPFTRRHDERWVAEDLCDGFIPQPISVANILDTVARFLH